MAIFERAFLLAIVNCCDSIAYMCVCAQALSSTSYWHKVRVYSLLLFAFWVSFFWALMVLMMPCQQQIHESPSLQNRNAMFMHMRFSENRHICDDYYKLLNNILSFSCQYCKWTDLTYVLFCYLIGFAGAVGHDCIIKIMWSHDAWHHASLTLSDLFLSILIAYMGIFQDWCH